MRIFPAYNDNREIVREFEAGEIKLGDEVIYRGQVCEILDDITGDDGVKYMELLIKGGLGGNIQFQFM